MIDRLAFAGAVVGMLAAGQASAAEPMHHHKPVPAAHHAAVVHHRAPTATYGVPNRQPLYSGDAPTTPRQGHVADPLAVPGSDAAIYNWSPDDPNAAFEY